MTVLAGLAASTLLAGCAQGDAEPSPPEKVTASAAPVGGDGAKGGGKSKSPDAKETKSASGAGKSGSQTGGSGNGGASGGGSSTGGGSASSGGGGGGSTGGSGNGGACASGDLDVSVGDNRPGAGQQNHPVVLTNHSGGTCTVTGYPGVAFVDGAGHPVSVAPERAPGQSTPVRLGPGESAWAPLSYSDPQVSGADTVDPASVRVTPPDEQGSLITVWPGGPVTSDGTASVPKIGPLTAGNGT